MDVGGRRFVKESKRTLIAFSPPRTRRQYLLRLRYQDCCCRQDAEYPLLRMRIPRLVEIVCTQSLRGGSTPLEDDRPRGTTGLPDRKRVLYAEFTCSARVVDSHVRHPNSPRYVPRTQHTLESLQFLRAPPLLEGAKGGKMMNRHVCVFFL